jgi:hypothetical protein
MDCVICLIQCKHRYLIFSVRRNIKRLNSRKNNDIIFSFIDGSGQLSDLKISSRKNEIPIGEDLNFEFACLDIKLVIYYLLRV